MRSIRCTDKAARFNSHTKIKILKTENNGGITNPLFDGSTYKTTGNFAHWSCLSSPLQARKNYFAPRIG